MYGDVIKDTLSVEIFKHKTQNSLCTILPALIIYFFVIVLSVLTTFTAPFCYIVFVIDAL